MDKVDDIKVQELLDDMYVKGIALRCISEIHTIIDNSISMIEHLGFECPSSISKIKSFVEKEEAAINTNGQKSFDKVKEYRAKCNHEYVPVGEPSDGNQLFSCKKCGNTKTEKL